VDSDLKKRISMYNFLFLFLNYSEVKEGDKKLPLEDDYTDDWY
jgi:hypothetical protein